MINPEQIRAGRAILDWSTSDLAKLTGLTINGINKIERGHVTAYRDTLETIQKTFEAAGLEFLPGSGVRKRDRIVETYEGTGANRRLVEDIFLTLRDTGGELLIAHLDEGDSIKNLEADFLIEQVQKRKKAGITHRLLVREGDAHVIPPLDTYRVLPDEYFSPYPLYIFGSKLALVSWEPAPRVVLVDDERFAESARKLFNFIWDRAEPLKIKKAKQ